MSTEYPAPNPYEHDLKKLRSAAATDASRAEADYKTDRLRDLAAGQRDLDAFTTSAPRLTAAEAAELRTYTPPDPYAVDLATLRIADARTLALRKERQ